MAFERVNAFGPEASERDEPGVEFLKRLGLDAVEAPLRVHGRFDESCVAEHAQMLGDCGLRETQRLLEFTDGVFGVDEQSENGAPRGFGEDVEGGLHTLSYIGRYIPVKVCTFSRVLVTLKHRKNPAS